MTENRTSPTIHILSRLHKAGGDYLSGRMLAEELGMSAVAVWQHIKRLQKEGFKIRGVRNRGYSLLSPPRTLHSDWILALLHSGDISPPAIHIHDSIDSTMDEAARLLAHNQPTPFAVITAFQETGRGRLGRPWHGKKDDNLLMTMAFRPDWTPNALQLYTPWIAVALADLLAGMGVPDLKVKWPKDLWTPRGKLAGVLVEARTDTDRMGSLSIGIGLNVNATAEDLLPVSDRAATSLLVDTGRLFDLNEVAVSCIQTILRVHETYGTRSPAGQDSFADRWNELDLLRGQTIAVTTAQEEVEGTAMGMDDAGALLVRTESGEIRRFHSGDAHLAGSFEATQTG